MDMRRPRFVLVVAILGLSNSQQLQRSTINSLKKLRGTLDGAADDTNGSHPDFATRKDAPPLWADDSNQSKDRKDINAMRPKVPSMWDKDNDERSGINPEKSEVIGVNKENAKDVPTLWDKKIEIRDGKESILTDSMELKRKDIPTLWKLNGKEVVQHENPSKSNIWQSNSDVQFVAHSSSQSKISKYDELQSKGVLPPLWVTDIHKREDLLLPSITNRNFQPPKSNEAFQVKPSSDEAVSSNLRLHPTSHKSSDLHKAGHEMRMNDLILTKEKSSQDPTANNGSSRPIRRKFISYQPSVWETFWLKHIEALSESRLICHVLLEDQLQYLRQYLEILCNRRLQSPYQNWCVIDDGYAPLWFNLENENRLELTFERPVPLLAHVSPPELIVPNSKYEEILSKFTFVDEITGEIFVEYIEPLVGHLRFPIQKCLHPFPVTPQYRNSFLSFRGWIIPPPPILKGENVVIVDSTSKALWESQRGGVTLKYLTETWRDYGVEVDRLLIVSEDTGSEEFLHNVPSNIASKVSFMKSRLAESSKAHSKVTPFLPKLIHENSSKEDYVILKLDLSDLDGLNNYLKYLTSPENLVDELIWEHKPEAMFISEKLVSTDLTLKESYEIVLELRQKGIRAHAWV